jgi:uncharacterized membrane protein
MYGPLDYVVIGFEGNQFNGEMMPAVQELVDKGIVRIIDLAIVSKDQGGAVTIIEVEQLDPAQSALLRPVAAEIAGLFTQDDLETIGAMLDNNSTALMILWENSWASRFIEAALKANGQVLARETVPADVLNEAIKAREAEMAAG